MSGRVRIRVDGEIVFAQPDSDFIDWTSIEFTVPCGFREIMLCLEAD